MKISFAFFTLLFFLTFCLHAQNQLDDRVYKTYDALVGQDNTGLYNGTEFTDLFLNTDGSYRYFNAFDYTKGSVTYKGQYYVNVLLKYDLLEDNLLTRSEDNLSIFNVKLIPQFVNSFSIYNRHFVRLTDTNLNLSGNGYFEVAVLGNDLELYIKHTKKKKDKALKSGIQYRFSEADFYILKSDGKYNIVSSPRDMRKILPQKEEEIKSYYKTYKKRYKSNPNVFMANLVKYLDGPKMEKNQL
ncbi:hypothetical protein K8089_07935 [Aequorivita sp. F47161]|uniref:Uncharacterized protein n=1 Tax=Aequorivita vitellina TaxID=2874475 RepID=A0A9X1QV74_9FLAO|nr:hypothetical protein [Aequorivita vitellina]MCG2418950.1 hypothetical protein [Aequorivita vitellina]